jgi:NADH-quinone oxidoreductase subunit M
MWPLHTWSPIGHAAAPSAASMLHAGVLMKLGGYGILRIGMTLLPAGALEWLPWVALICCMNIVYGGLVAMAQKDLKFIIGFSSSSHMGYVLLGLATMQGFGMTGAVFLMFAHGIMTALAFGLIGFFYDQTHTRWVPDLGGLAHQIPFVGTAFAIMTLASLGLPGFANFASELMVIFGAWGASEHWKTAFGGAYAGWSWHYTVATIAAVWGIVVTATYLLRALRDVFYGPRLERWDGLRDAETWFQRAPFILLIAVLTITGCYPPIITDVIDGAVEPLVARIHEIATVVAAGVGD